MVAECKAAGMGRLMERPHIPSLGPQRKSLRWLMSTQMSLLLFSGPHFLQISAL